MLDLATSRVLELGIGDVLNLDFSGLGVDYATIFAHDKRLQQCGQNYCELFPRAAEASGKTSRQAALIQPPHDQLSGGGPH